MFEKLVPSVSPLLKKHIRLGHAGIVDHAVDLSIPDFKKYKNGMDRSNKKSKNIIEMRNSKYQCHMAAGCTYHRPTYFS